MNQTELDETLRELLKESLSRAMEIATSKHDEQQLREIAHLIATCVSWESDEEEEDNPVGFQKRGSKK